MHSATLTIRRACALSFFIFTVGALLGYAIGLQIPPSGGPACAATDPVPSSSVMFRGILVRNLIVYLLLLGGVITLGLLSAAVLLLNGVSIGLALGMLWTRGCMGLGLHVTIPHGLLEIPALLIGGAIGLRGLGAFGKLTSDEMNIRLFWNRSVWCMAIVGVLLLTAAALVEATVTRQILLENGPNT